MYQNITQTLKGDINTLGILPPGINVKNGKKMGFITDIDIEVR